MNFGRSMLMQVNDYKTKKIGKLTFVKSKCAKDFENLINKEFIRNGRVVKRCQKKDTLIGDPSWLVTNSLGIQDFDKIKILFEETKNIKIGANNVVYFTITAKPMQRKLTLNFVKLEISGSGCDMKFKSRILNKQVINL